MGRAIRRALAGDSDCRPEEDAASVRVQSEKTAKWASSLRQFAVTLNQFKVPMAQGRQSSAEQVRRRLECA